MVTVISTVQRAVRRVRKLALHATKPRKLHIPYVNPEGQSSGTSDQSTWQVEQGGAEFHLNAVLSEVPLDKFLSAAVMRNKKSRVNSLTDFLNQSVATPELLVDYLTEHECSVVGELEELKAQVHEQAAPSTSLVSVIMPTRNTLDEQFSAAIQSVLYQTHENLELLILDHAGSLLVGDASIVSDSRVRIVDARHLEGLGAVRQEGLAQARGEFIAWLDDDDLWDKRHLRISLDQIARRDLVAFYSATLATSGKVGKSGLGSRFEYIRWTPFRRTLLDNRNIIGTPTLVHKNLGPKALTIPLNRFTDWVTACQLAEQGPIGSLPIILSFYNTRSRVANVSAAKTTAHALVAFRQWQRERFPTWQDHSEVPSDPVAPGETAEWNQVPTTVVIVSLSADDRVADCVRSLGLEHFPPHTVDLVLVNASGQATHHACLTDIASSSPFPATVVESQQGNSAAAVAAGHRHVPERSEAVVVVDAAAQCVNGSVHTLVAAMFSTENVDIAVPEMLVSPDDQRFIAHWRNQHGDHPVDIAFSVRDRNAHVGDPSAPEESLQMTSAPLIALARKVSGLAEFDGDAKGVYVPGVSLWWGQTPRR